MSSFPRSLFGPSLPHGAPGSHDPGSDDRFLSPAQCRDLVARIFSFGTGGGKTYVGIDSAWFDNLRWGRNEIATGGESQRSNVNINREIHHAFGGAWTNALTDDALQRCVRHAESLILFNQANPDDYPDPPRTVLPCSAPVLWFDATVSRHEPERTAVVDGMIAPAASANLLSAGFLEVAARAQSVITSDGLERYYPYSTVQCSLTVRDLAGRGSGWAGVDWNDIARVDATRLAQIAVEKCQRSRNPVAVEPGRFTAILEPQAVCDLVAPIVEEGLDRLAAEQGRGPFADPQRIGYSRMGQRVIDPRLTLGADPMDPDGGFVPFDGGGEPFLAVNWIERGVLKALSYDRIYGVTQLGMDASLKNSFAFHLRGDATSTASVDDMIANTTRGVLVTRLNHPRVLDSQTLLMNGNTRDGLWLIEHGKVSKAIKNMRFTESPLFVLNNVEAIGRAQRVFRPFAPAVVPPLMVRDFSFTGLVDAV